jgi:hypothetical protein
MLNLSDVRWSGNTLLLFLTLQPFSSDVSLKLANASFPTTGEGDPFALLMRISLPVQRLVELSWDKNPLTPCVIRHLEQFTQLQRLSLEFCQLRCDSQEAIVDALLHFISTSKIKKLSLRGSIQPLGGRFITSLRDALLSHRTITHLNIADNAIGVSGLRDLKDVIVGRSHLSQVWADGSRPDDPAEFIGILNDLGQSASLVFFAKPRTDIDRLVQAHPSAQAAIKAAWRRLAGHLRENTAKMQEESGDRPFDDCSGSQPLLDFAGVPVSVIDASWDISIELGYGGDIVEWDLMRGKYSVERLIGAERLALDGPVDLLEVE